MHTEITQEHTIAWKTQLVSTLNPRLETLQVLFRNAYQGASTASSGTARTCKF